MLGIFIVLFLLYFIGKNFYELAHDYNKNRWLYAILGIVSYYLGTFLAGVIIGIFDVIAQTNYHNTLSKIALSLIAMPFGILACWGFYKILANAWEKKIIIKNSETLDEHLMN